MEVLTGEGDVRKQTNFRLAEIDNIHKSGDILHYDLSFQGGASCSVRNRRHAPLSFTCVNRYASSSRIGLMDSTVPVEAVVGL